MTTSFPVTKTGLALAAASFLSLALLAAPVRADDKVLAKVNGAEIKQSDVTIVAKAAEDKKIADTDEFKKRLNFTRNRLLMDSLLAAEGKAATNDAAMKQ